MRRQLTSAIVAIALGTVSAAPASAVQRQDEVQGATPESVRLYLESLLQQKFGRAALDEVRKARSSIMVTGTYGEFPLEVPLNMLVRTPGGWANWTAVGQVPLAPAASAEIDSILASRVFWNEALAFTGTQPCTGGAMIMVVRHQGRVKPTRQPCGPAGVTGRLAALAAQLRPLPPAIKPPPPPDISGRPTSSQNGRLSPIDDPEVSRIVWNRSQESAAGWNRGNLEAYLAPYAEDVTILWPASGLEYHRTALRKRALAAQSWNGPPARKMEVHTSTLRQIAPYVVLQTSHIYYSGGGRPDTQSWVTTIWQNRRGNWEVTHEQPAPEVPGHSR